MGIFKNFKCGLGTRNRDDKEEMIQNDSNNFLSPRNSECIIGKAAAWGGREISLLTFCTSEEKLTRWILFKCLLSQSTDFC